MNEVVLAVDEDGNYYAFDAERYAATKATEDEAETHAFSAEEIDAARVTDDGDRQAIEEAVGADEVTGFANAIPGVDVKMVKKPGGLIHISVLGHTRGAGGGGISLSQPGSLGIAITENGVK